jgi:hypothetical protein
VSADPLLDLIAQARKSGLRVANLYEGTDGRWRCVLYRRSNERPSNWQTGDHATPAGALRAAMGIPRALLVNDLDDIM